MALRAEASGGSPREAAHQRTGRRPIWDGASVVLDVRELDVSVYTPGGRFQIIGGVRFQVLQGEAVGIVGESGCGKSTTARAIMGTLPSPPTRIDRGSITFNGRELLGLNRTRAQPAAWARPDDDLPGPEHQPEPGLHHRRPARIDPALARAPVVAAVQRLARASAPGARARRRDAGPGRAAVPHRVMESYPFQLSGGMRQRVLIAMALLNESEAGGGRRARHGAGRHDPGSDPRAVRVAPGQQGAVAALHHPQSRDRPADHPADRRHVRRGDRRGGPHQADFRPAAPPVHEGAARLHPDVVRWQGPGDRGTHSRSGPHARRLPLPSAMLLRTRRLQARDAAAAAGRGWPPGGLPSLRPCCQRQRRAEPAGLATRRSSDGSPGEAAGSP